MKSELTELEMRADQEAEAERIQQLSAEYQAAIERQLGDIHKARTCVDRTAEEVAFKVLPAIIRSKLSEFIEDDINIAFKYGQAYIKEMNRRKQKND